MAIQQYLATCPKGLENPLAKELERLGVAEVSESVAGCYFSASLEQAYTICIFSRLANRIVALLLREQIDSVERLRESCSELEWSHWFEYTQTLAVDFNGSNHYVRDSRYGAQLVKDTVNDHFVAKGLSRLSVDVEKPDVLIYVRLFKNRVSLGIDMVGESLHKRGYRVVGGAAPLKENLAAALLMLADWPAKSMAGEPFIDPMCGSGTLLIEAALMQQGIAPSYLRKHWALPNLKNYDAGIWQKLQDGLKKTPDKSEQRPLIQGFDRDPRSLAAAQQNIAAAGLESCIELQQMTITDAKNPFIEKAKAGLVVVNPPYGQRLGDIESLATTYRDFGDFLKTQCMGWDAAVFTGNPDLGWSTGLRSWRQHKLFNGAIAAQLQRYKVESKNFTAGRLPQDGVVRAEGLNAEAAMVANRLKKNLRRLAGWLKANPDICYRLYDADLPEYAVAIDCYTGMLEDDSDTAKQVFYHLQEYAAPTNIDTRLAKKRLQNVIAALSAVTGCPRKNIILKQRERQKGAQQYQSGTQDAPNLRVHEAGHVFQVNLQRYLDTGLFLDHRLVRQKIAEFINGKSFLNLFSYTSAASVYAAKAGAVSSVSVDMSQTYIKWSADNFALNKIDPWQHKLRCADCLVWLTENRELFDCILLDPPSFSNSKKMQQTLDIQRDHQTLVEQSMQHLAAQGRLYFSTNRRGFKLAAALVGQYKVSELTKLTRDQDFNRPRPAHQCWLIEHLPQAQS